LINTILENDGATASTAKLDISSVNIGSIEILVLQLFDLP
jgi:hypothetical protein